MRFFLVLTLHFCLAWPVFSQQDTVLNYDSMWDKVLAGQPGYKTVSMRAKMDWSNDLMQQDFQANIRMVKDSLVWMSMTGPMGIEAARMLVTPDSFKVLNKLTNEYLARDFSYIQSWFLFPVSFSMFQQILMGQPLSIGDNSAKAITIEDSLPVLYIETDKLQEKIRVDSLNYTIRKILLKDKLVKQDMAITFDAYKPEEGKSFPYQRTIEVNRDGVAMKLGMEVTKIRWNEELTFPFEIGDKTKRIE